jgi:hypothetical protein
MELESWAPASCTLPTAARPLRVAEFDDLFATSVTGVERVAPDELRLDLVAAPEVAARAAELVVRETGCCSFFTFTLTATAGTLTLGVAVSDAHVDVLDALAARTVAQR